MIAAAYALLFLILSAFICVYLRFHSQFNSN